jgi:hypothetical protein
MRPSRPAFFFFLLIIFLVLCSSRARKLRTWLGPNNMISGTAPYPRAFITLSSADSKLYIFGGFTNAGRLELSRFFAFFPYPAGKEIMTLPKRTGDFNDLYQFNTATLEWIDLSGYTTGVTPFARDSHGVTHCAGRLYVFGGFYGPGEILSAKTIQIERIVCPTLRATERSPV